MGVGARRAEGIGAGGKRDFRTFRTVSGVIGGIPTGLGSGGGVFIGGEPRRSSSRLAAAAARRGGDRRRLIF